MAIGVGSEGSIKWAKTYVSYDVNYRTPEI